MNKNIPAGFLLRLLASLVDLAIFILPISYLIFTISQNNSLTSIYQTLIIALIILIFYLLFQMIYSVLFTHYFGGTLGKLFTGLRVKDQDGQKLGFKKVAFRQLLAYRFSLMLFGLGFFAILKSPTKQAWHDHTVDSNVFKTQPFLFILAIVVLASSVFANGYLLKNSFNNFLNNPAKQELLGIAVQNSLQKEISSPAKDPNSVKTDEIYAIFLQVSPENIQEFASIFDLQKNGKNDEIIKKTNDLQPKLKNDADKTLANLILARIYFDNNQLSEAKKAIQNVIKYSPNLSLGYNYLTQINLAEKNYKEALINAKKAVELNPNQAENHFFLSTAYYMNGNFKDALVEINKSIELDPQNQEYKTQLNYLQQQNSASPTKSPITQPQTTNLNYNMEDINYWQQQLNIASQDLANITRFSNFSAFNNMKNYAEQRKAIAERIVGKMNSRQILSDQDLQDAQLYLQLTDQFNNLSRAAIGTGQAQ